MSTESETRETRETTEVPSCYQRENNVTWTPSNPDYKLGCVKWFDARRGYGYIMVYTRETGECVDYFVHHSGIDTDTDVFKTLVAGEYVQFSTHRDNKDRECASNVCGVNGGPLQCETDNMRRLYRQGFRRGLNTGTRRNGDRSRGRGRRYDYSDDEYDNDYHRRSRSRSRDRGYQQSRRRNDSRHNRRSMSPN